MLKNLSSTFITGLLSLIAGLFTNVLVARFLGTVGRGELAAAMLWPTTLAALGTLGLTESITFYTGKSDPSQIRGLVTAASLLGIAQSVVLGATGFLIIPAILHSQTSLVIQAAQVFQFIIPLSLLLNYQRSILLGCLAIKKFNALFTLPVCLYALGVLLLGFSGHLTLLSSILAFLLSHLLGLLLGYYWLQRNDLLRWSSPAPWFRLLISYGLKAHIGNISSMLNLRLDQMLMSAFLPSRELGLYVVAVTVSGAVGLISNTVATVTFPVVTRNNVFTDQVYLLGRMMRLGFWCSILVAGITILASPTLIPLVFGADFSDSALASQILSVASVIFGLNVIMKNGLKGLGLPKISTAGEMLGLIATVLFLVLLIPTLQILGAAIASLLAYSVSLCYFVFYAGTTLRLNPVSMVIPQPEDWSLISSVFLLIKRRVGLVFSHEST
jgi:O-antigen/teichoic acid export membrane protein